MVQPPPSERLDSESGPSGGAETRGTRERVPIDGSSGRNVTPKLCGHGIHRGATTRESGAGVGETGGGIGGRWRGVAEGGWSPDR